MWGSGTYNVGLDFTNGNAKLFNGYLNSLNPTNTPTGTNTITFTNLSPAQTYTIIAYTLRDAAGAQAAYWVNEDFANAIVLLSEDENFWLGDPTFRQGTNTVRPATDYANYVRWDGVAPRPDGTISVNVRSEFDIDPPSFNYRGPINGLQLISTNSFPTNASLPAITLQPVNRRVNQGNSGTFNMNINGPWSVQWYSNNVVVPNATNVSFTTAPLLNQAGATNKYKAVVSNNVGSVTSSIVNMILLPALPPGGIFYDEFDYPAGPLGNLGDWNASNIAGITNYGLTYIDAQGNSLQVGGYSMIPPRQTNSDGSTCWCDADKIPVKTFGDTKYGGTNSVIYVSFLADLGGITGAGGIGVSGFNGPADWGNEQFFIGKSGGDLVWGFATGPSGNSTASIVGLSFVVVRITFQDEGDATFEMFVNPSLAELPATPDLTSTRSQFQFDGVGVNAGDWQSNGNPTGPLFDEFRFGTTYASVAPIAPPQLMIQLISSNVQLSWPTTATGFSLQQSDSLSATNWVAAPTGNPVTIPAPEMQRFYRLKQ